MPRFISALFLALPFINWPTILGWLIFLLFFGASIWLYTKNKEYQPLWEMHSWLQFGGLFLLTIVSNLFVGVYISTSSMMTWPGMPIESPGAALMIFGALGWMIAGGTLGPLAAFSLAVIAGLIRVPFDTHTIFTTLEFGFLAILFSISVRQRYRTSAYKILRHFQHIISARHLF